MSRALINFLTPLPCFISEPSSRDNCVKVVVECLQTRFSFPYFKKSFSPESTWLPRILVSRAGRESVILGLTSKYFTQAKEYCYSTVNYFFQKAALEYATQSTVSLGDECERQDGRYWVKQLEALS